MYLTIPIDKEIYRGRKTDNNIHGKWFALDVDSAKGYGTKIGKYKPQRELKLINLLSSDFHKSFMEKLTLEYTGNNYDGFDQNKLLLMLPLGLPDYHSQLQVASTLGIQTGTPPSDPLMISYWKTLNNVSRFSEYNIDTSFANKMEEYYQSDCDGFILPIRCPNIPMNGIFHRELYVFDSTDINYISDIPQPTIGGAPFEEQKVIGPFRFFKDAADMHSFFDKMHEDFMAKNPQKPLILNEHIVGGLNKIKNGGSQKQNKRFTRKKTK